MRSSAQINDQMVAVERCLEYCDLELENQPKNPIPITADWPSKGCIEFRNVFYRYNSDAEPVLRDLSFLIEPTQKIGIVGRTGAGKSSLIASLFRLACIDGEILIDEIDTANIPLDELRKRIAIIPQDPVLFSGTLRRFEMEFVVHNTIRNRFDTKWFSRISGISIHLMNIPTMIYGVHSKVLN